MKVSYNWLTKQFTTQLPKPEEIADVFTFRVFEVESMERVGGDTIFDLKVLPDRAHYALSWEGIAYELGAALGISRKKIEVSDVVVSKDVPLVEIAIGQDISDAMACRRYSTRRVHGVKVTESPEWLRNTLEAQGQRSINSIVDATNIIMLSTGQPLHAFDADKVVGALSVRLALSGEKITVLDGREVSLDPTMLVIADAQGPLAIAGVKGGKRAEVTAATTSLILESANFDPSSVRRTSSRVQIKNDSSKRFENDPTPELTAVGMKRLSNLIAELSPSAHYGAVTDVYPKPVNPRMLSFSLTEVSAMLGIEVSEDTAEKLLKSLDFEVQKKDGKIWTLGIPAFRLDLVIPEDVTEEIGRLIGYDSIPSKLPTKSSYEPKVNSQFYGVEKIKNILIEQGFSETILYTLGKKGHYETAYPVASDKAFLRTSQLPGLEESIVVNTRNADLLEQDVIQQFEIGKVFDKEGEHLHCGLAVGFSKKIKGNSPKDVIQAVIEKLSAALGVSLEIKTQGERDLVAWAEVSLEYAVSKISIPSNYSDLSFEKASSAKYLLISPYPFAVRDVAVFVPHDVAAEQVQEIVNTHKGKYCVRLRLFDVFSKKTGDGSTKTSYAFRLVFQAMDKTLSEEEIAAPMVAIYAAFKEKGWEIR